MKRDPLELVACALFTVSLFFACVFAVGCASMGAEAAETARKCSELYAPIYLHRAADEALVCVDYPTLEQCPLRQAVRDKYAEKLDAAEAQCSGR